MKEIILKTRITSKVGHERKLLWTRPPIFLKAGESLVIDDAYPTAINGLAVKDSFRSDINLGLVEIELITSLPVQKVDAEDIPTFHSNVTCPTAASIQPVVDAKPVDERWARGTLDTVKPPTAGLPGADAVQRPEDILKTVSVFGDMKDQEHKEPELASAEIGAQVAATSAPFISIPKTR